MAGGPVEHTTIGVVATNAALDKAGCRLVAESAHAGLARALEPVASTLDGDAIVAASTQVVEGPLERVRMLAARAAEDAVRAVAGGGGEPPERRRS